MRPHRQRIGILVLLVAGLASLATSQSTPAVAKSVAAEVGFADGQRVETRRLHISLQAGSADAVVQATLVINTTKAGKSPVPPIGVAVTRDGGGEMAPRDYRTDVQDMTVAWIAELPLFACRARQTCEDSLAITLTWRDFDTRAALTAELSINVSADYPVDNESPPPDARLTLELAP